MKNRKNYTNFQFAILSCKGLNTYKLSMINSIKGIVSGISFIIVSMLLMQLFFILLSVAYNHIANEISFLKDIKWIFKYLFGIPVFIAIMFLGGYITTSIAKVKPIINSIIVGLIIITGMMLSALVNAELTLTGVIINIIMIVAIVSGGLFASRK